MPPTEPDPLASLRDALSEEDEPLFAPNPVAAAAPAAPKASGGPPPLPPPLPKARTGNFDPVAPSGKTGNTGIPVQRSGQAGNSGIPLKTGVVPPNASPAIAQLQGLQPAPAYAIPALPPMVQRPTAGDPFGEPPEPRIPVGVDSEEKLKVFRQIMKGKDEALGRGRSIFQAVDLEAQQLRAIATQMKGQLDLAMIEVQKAAALPQQVQLLKDMLEKDTVRADAAEKKMEDLVARYAEADNELHHLLIMEALGGDDVRLTYGRPPPGDAAVVWTCAKGPRANGSRAMRRAR
jgi:hypothetical protein